MHHQSIVASTHSVSAEARTGGELPRYGAAQEIDPITLATLNFGLFNSLRRLGTSRESICSALCLSYSEFDYLSAMPTHR